jgi:hypothetical protein
MAKKTYVQLLKEAIAEFDTSDNVEVKGPMLDPILSWRGDGELPTNKDAASILERYYFNEDADKPLDTAFENDKGDASGEAMDHAEGTGTEQAGTSEEDTIKGALDDKEEEIAKESYFFLEQDHDEEKESDEDEEDEDEETQKKEKEEGTEKHDVKENLFFMEADEPEPSTDEGEGDAAEDETQDAVDDAEEAADKTNVGENAIIEKLISELEEEDGVMTYTDDEPKVGWPDEKEADGPMDHAEGSGTEQAGTGDAEGQIPDRDDLHDDMVEPKEYTDESFDIQEAITQFQGLLEEEEAGEEDEEDEDEEEAGEDDESKKKLNVDKEVAQESAPSGVPGGPGPKNRGEDWEDDEAAYSEGFRIFKEEIEGELTEDLDDISSKNLRV